ncbi:MAG: LL-diaminopimelate aminotransferase [Thermodesulfobacteriota bacterium]
MKKFDRADRIVKLPPYLFAEIDRKKAEVKARGVDIIDLGVGDPDLPTPPHIVEALSKAAADPRYHRYPSYSGMGSFNEAVARFYKRRFNVALDPKTEVITLIGSKEGIAHLPLAYINPGDMALCPSPAYPVYAISVSFCGGTPYLMDLKKENGFLPDLAAIPGSVADSAKLMFLNYPNNPTAAVADTAFFQKVVEFAKDRKMVVAHDAAYTEMGFDGYEPMSFLQVPGAKDLGIEFHSLSKTYNMTGWRLGFAVGNADVIQALGKVKSNIDSGAFDAIQMAGIAALDGDQSCVAQNMAIYTERRDMLAAALSDMGLTVNKPKASFYIWGQVPKGTTSADFCTLLLERCGIVATPGNGFGAAGEGFFRMALTVSAQRIAEAVERMKKLAF